MNTPVERVVVRVPATTANLGPGFDALGLALSLYNRFDVQLLPSGYEVETVSSAAVFEEAVPTGSDNLVIQAAEATWKVIGRRPVGWRIRLQADIPLGSGLGSSATAIVGGVVAANALAGQPLSVDEMLQIAVELEGHADNVTPALVGGFTVVVRGEDGAVTWERFEIDHVDAVVAVPDEPLATGRSRRALPDTVSHADATFNVGRASLLTAALASGNVSAMAAALEDRLHQPYREPLVPGFADVVRAAVREGALGAVLSGAGPSIIAFIPGEARAEPIGIAMVSAFREAGIGAHWLALQPDRDGAIIE